MMKMFIFVLIFFKSFIAMMLLTHGSCAVALSEWQERLVGSRELIQDMEAFEDDVTNVSELFCNQEAV